MSPELVKQLKDAGFPIRRYPEWALAKDGLVPAIEWEKNYVPTLSDLIEACGKNFRSLNRGDVGWSADAVNREGYAEASAGETPEEAVANLWLALNKK